MHSFLLNTLLLTLLLALQGCGGASDSKAVEEKTTTTDQPAIKSENISTQFCSDSAKLKTTHFDREFPYSDPKHNGVLVEKLLTSFVVKEPAGIAAINQPTSMVFPLTFGKYFHTGDFHIKNSDGEVIPAQFNVLNRWWAKDRSLRHVQAHFTIDVPAYVEGEEVSGRKTFYLYAGTANKSPENAVCTIITDKNISIANGLIAIEIQKQPLVITTPAGKLTSLLTTESNRIDESFNHDDIIIELEEVGPQRSVIKLSSKTNYVSAKNIKHGWALRLYVHANSSLVKTEFQLQNSALNTVFSAPLYFKSHQLVLDGSGSVAVSEIKADKLNDMAINSGKAGYISTPNVNVFVRDFWQRFPNGLKATATGKVHIELYPAWSKQYLNSGFSIADYYWLDDMRQSYKEVLFDFSPQHTGGDIERVASHFQFQPVVVIPQQYYQETSVTLDFGGFFPLAEQPIESIRTPQYKASTFSKLVVGSHQFGQNNFGLDLARKRATAQTGGVPYSNRQFFISGNPRDYYFAQTMAKAEINIRPQWLSGYTHENDFTSIRPSTNPYSGSTWRKFSGHGIATLTREYDEGSKQVANPRDDQHAWFFHLEQAYLMSGNKWLKDWYEFMAEFKQVYLQELDPWPDRTNRSEGHAINTALAAYRITGNENLGVLLSHYAQKVHSKYLLAPHYISVGSLTKENPKAAVFQQGYLVKSFIDLFYEFPEQTVTLELIKNYVDWNYQYANFSYYRSVLDYDVSIAASGTAMSFIDIAMWYSLYSGDKKYAQHAIDFVNFGVGGKKPYGKWKNWQGQYESQIYNYYLQQLNEGSY
jgi:hypothetical protein